MQGMSQAQWAHMQQAAQAAEAAKSAPDGANGQPAETALAKAVREQADKLK